MSKILWKPDQERIQNSRMFQFLRAVNESFSLNFTTYSELHQWSIQELETFWEFYREYSDIIFNQPPSEILSSRIMPGARWFSDAKLNYAENLLKEDSEKPAILSKLEGQPLISISYSELNFKARQFAIALLQLGIKPGDRVAGYLPNIPETVVAMLGTAAIGAVWTSCSPDFGLQGIRDRFGQIEPSVLIATDGYTYNGKPFSVISTLNALLPSLKNLKHLVLIPFLDVSVDKNKIDFSKTSTWDEFCRASSKKKLQFHSVPFNHPLFIMYSSGTTGKPKCIVHGTGGTLLQHHKEHALHTDIGPEDVVFFYTTCGWMMWNWLVSALAQKATIVLCEGSPGFPNIKVLWDLIEEANISIFGTSPKFLAQNIKNNFLPSQYSNFPTLRTILSTGSPLDNESFEWVYKNVKEELQLSSICGGTDIISCFMLGNPMLPVIKGEIQCLGLGMDVASLDEYGQPVINKKGELACQSPAPSMPVGFWNDTQDLKYFEAYFNKVPGIWIHGDYIEILPHGGIIVYGRSDATLNPGGIRIGTAEIYQIVEQMEEVVDSLVIGLDEDSDICVILFLVLKNGNEFTIQFQQKVKNILRQEATPRHIPQEIYSVHEIPKTLNGKKMEMAVRKIFHGESISNNASMANSKCLDEFKEISEKRLVGKNV